MIAAVGRSGLALVLWTVNADAALARWMGEAETIVTDRPDRALELGALAPW